jgi:hypothetical protein
LDDQIKKNEMCIGEVHIGCWQGSLRERDHLVDVGIDGKILKWLVKKWDGGGAWTGWVRDM